MIMAGVNAPALALGTIAGTDISTATISYDVASTSQMTNSDAVTLIVAEVGRDTNAGRYFPNAAGYGLTISTTAPDNVAIVTTGRQSTRHRPDRMIYSIDLSIAIEIDLNAGVLLRGSDSFPTSTFASGK
jgi:hypothetical protein